MERILTPKALKALSTRIENVRLMKKHSSIKKLL